MLFSFLSLAFLLFMLNPNSNKGLAFCSEQASESVHYDFKHFEESGYKVSSTLKNNQQSHGYLQLPTYLL